MADRRPPSYPPVGDDDRFDRIVARGQSLKRRRQLTRVAGAGGAFAVVALVTAMAVSLGSSPDDAVVANTPTTTSTVPTTTAPTTTAPTTTTPEGVTIRVVPKVTPLQIIVTDPEQPIGKGTQQCLGISVYESEAAAENGALATHEGWICPEGGGSAGNVDLPVVAAGSVTEVPPDGVDLGGGMPVDGANVGPCAVAVENVIPVVSGTAVGETTFTVIDLPRGSYWVELTAWSGIGDGCGDEQSPYERENIETTSESITVP